MARKPPPPSKPRHTKADVMAAIRKRRGKLYLAAADLRITPQTLRNYMRRWPDVRKAVAEAKGKMLDVAESKLLTAIEKGQPWAICFYLKCQAKQRGYVERTEQRIGGDAKAPLTVEHARKLTDDERLAAIRDLAGRVCQRRLGTVDAGGTEAAGRAPGTNGQSGA